MLTESNITDLNNAYELLADIKIEMQLIINEQTEYHDSIPENGKDYKRESVVEDRISLLDRVMKDIDSARKNIDLVKK